MSFPLDPNAPGGPRRSEYVSSQYKPADDAKAEPKYRGGIAALRHLRRREVRIVESRRAA